MDRNEDPIEFPIDGRLDLHTFRPSEVKDLVSEYIDVCLARGIRHIRIIHGKGTGTLREIVWSILEKHQAVTEYGHDQTAGGWGATAATLKVEN